MAKSYANQIPKEGLSIDGKRIDRVTETKYLGLTIDHKLKWDAHINQRIASCRKLLFCLKGFVGKARGPSPEMITDAYTVRHSN